LIGLFGNPFLVLIAVFVWMGAAQEASLVQMKSALNSVPVSQVMITDFRTLVPEDTLSRAVETLLAGYQQDFPVLRDEKLAGLLTRNDLVNGLVRLDPNMPVADAMEKNPISVQPSESAEAVFRRLQTGSHRSIMVTQDGQLVGMVTLENIAEFLMIRAALMGESQRGRRAFRMEERHAT
jgi:predicted transcriptional regulator